MSKQDPRPFELRLDSLDFVLRQALESHHAYQAAFDRLVQCMIRSSTAEYLAQRSATTIAKERWIRWHQRALRLASDQGRLNELSAMGLSLVAGQMQLSKVDIGSDAP